MTNSPVVFHFNYSPSCFGSSFPQKKSNLINVTNPPSLPPFLPPAELGRNFNQPLSATLLAISTFPADFACSRLTVTPSVRPVIGGSNNVPVFRHATVKRKTRQQPCNRARIRTIESKIRECPTKSSKSPRDSQRIKLFKESRARPCKIDRFAIASARFEDQMILIKAECNVKMRMFNLIYTRD